MPTLNKNKTEKLDQILTEAAKLFRQKGFGGTGMRDLAAQLGMEAASMYYHIGSKDEILEKICFQVANNYLEHLEEKELIRFHVRMMIVNGPEVSVTNHDWKYLTKEKLSEFKGLRKLYEVRLETLICSGISAGELVTVNPQVALFTILSSLRWVEYWWKPERGISAKELENNIIILLLKGIEK